MCFTGIHVSTQKKRRSNKSTIKGFIALFCFSFEGKLSPNFEKRGKVGVKFTLDRGIDKLARDVNTIVKVIVFWGECRSLLSVSTQKKRRSNKSTIKGFVALFCSNFEGKVSPNFEKKGKVRVKSSLDQGVDELVRVVNTIVKVTLFSGDCRSLLSLSSQKK